MSYRIETTRRARADRDNCFDYINERDPGGALRWLDAYETAVESLSDNPNRGLAPESEYCDGEIRQCHFKTRRGLYYRLLFTIFEDVIYILHVRGPGQDLMARDDLRFPEES